MTPHVQNGRILWGQILASLIALAAVATTEPASAEKIASVDGITSLVVVTQSTAAAAAQDLLTAAKKQQEVIDERQRIRNQTRQFEATLDRQRREDEERHGTTLTAHSKEMLAVATNMTAVASSIPSAGAPAELCRSESGGIQPLVENALTNAETALANVTASVQTQQKRIQERKTAAERAVLARQLKTLQDALQRATAVSSKIRELLKAVRGLKPCA